MPTLDSARQRGRRALVRSMRAVVDNDRIPLVAKQLFVMLAAGPYVEPRGGLLRLLGTDSDQTPIESAYGTKFTPDGDNSIVTFWLRFRDVYEPVLSEFLLRHLREGDVCVDAGANIGYFSALLAQRVGPGGKVIAIEAAPGTARLLRKNLQLNGVDAVVEVIEAACAPQRGEMTFYLHPTVDGCSRLTPPAKGDWDHRKGLEWIPVTVQADTLSALVGADADRVSFLKVDVEGAETALAPDIATGFTHPRLVVALEVRSEIEATLEPFRQHGFHIYDLHNDYRWIYQRKTPQITEAAYEDFYDCTSADILLSRQPLDVTH
ncbi:hypothetical protein MANY_23270 [Mycolicibacterium anyangense]|uniref:Methyltransferase FkbM domain-containing protein n=1 Tax=Mycolicibacterium anyangense TaxID=1431246 RepID=A0A6N4W4X2_9MYCO|nr:FkbM family methyltransferase [Mycolicibacterium anyangense]BBZ76990.1 hypothetical protein MANY_23270 [Mycolicibacterium anyangense]